MLAWNLCSACFRSVSDVHCLLVNCFFFSFVFGGWKKTLTITAVSTQWLSFNHSCCVAAWASLRYSYCWTSGRHTDAFSVQLKPPDHRLSVKTSSTFRRERREKKTGSITQMRTKRDGALPEELRLSEFVSSWMYFYPRAYPECIWFSSLFDCSLFLSIT